MIVNDQAITSFDRAYMACAESHAGGARDTSERCCIAAGVTAAVPFVIAAHVDDAGEDESHFADWWMSQYEAAHRSPSEGNPGGEAAREGVERGRRVTTPPPIKISNEMVVPIEDVIISGMDPDDPRSVTELARTAAETVAPLIAAQVLRGVTWVELDNSHEEPRMVITGNLEVLRELAGRCAPLTSGFTEAPSENSRSGDGQMANTSAADLTDDDLAAWAADGERDAGYAEGYEQGRLDGQMDALATQGKVYVVAETVAHTAGGVLGVTASLDAAKALVDDRFGRAHEWTNNDRGGSLAWVTTPSWDAYEIEEWEIGGGQPPAAQRREQSEPSKVSNVDKTDGGRSLTEDAP